MHLLETYALSCGLKIDKPYVFEHYTTVPFGRFISFNRKHYPFYSEVISLIKPVLDKEKIDILQLKAANDTADTSSIVTDSLTFGQWAYLMRRSLLHFGEDDFLFDLAGFYDVPRVILFSNTYPNNFKPYWGDESKQRIIFELGSNKKPSFSSDINLDFVRLIKPEVIAQNIMDLLGISWSPPYKTVFAGQQYRPHHDLIEIVPDKSKTIHLNGRASAINVRMDYNFDEQFLVNVIEKTKACIVTDKPINLNIIQTFRNNISEVVYLVDENSDLQFTRGLRRLNIPSSMISFSSSSLMKERFFEIGTINNLSVTKLSDIPALKDGLKGLFYKSAKRVLHGDLEYKGLYEFSNKTPSVMRELSPCPENATDEFLKELDFFLIVQPVTS